ncbi:MAG: flavin reductase [Selenomonadaceae bacterium]|nr:flavin reductase [Selenomonadaceae bacterium]
MNSKVMFNIQYGLFVLSTNLDGMDNACIINTVTQVTAAPVSKDRITICVNKSNFTHDLIAASKKFTVSIISEAATFDLFKHFGFQSGKNVDKFANFDKVQRTENGTLAITEGTNSYISANVINQVELDTHSIFVAEVVGMEKFNDIPSTTYNFYQSHIKPKPQPVGKTADGKTVWRCRICGYEYVGEEIPADFVCRFASILRPILKKLRLLPKVAVRKNL